jgi:hypothetical protein
MKPQDVVHFAKHFLLALPSKSRASGRCSPGIAELAGATAVN